MTEFKTICPGCKRFVAFKEYKPMSFCVNMPNLICKSCGRIFDYYRICDELDHLKEVFNGTIPQEEIEKFKEEYCK